MSKLNVKVGDKVIVRTYWHGTRISTVEKITPSGLIKVDGTLYYESGMERSSSFSPNCIEEYTEEKANEIHKNSVIKNCLSLMRDTHSITYEQAVGILEILSKDGGNNE